MNEKTKPKMPLQLDQKILKNACYLLTGNVGVRVFTAVAIILVTRYLGPADYGALAVALAFSSLAAYGSDLGLTQTFIREGSRPGANIPELMGSTLKLRLVFSAIATIVMFVLVPLIYRNPDIRLIILWTTGPGIWGTALQGLGAAYFQLTEKMQYTALIRGLAALLNGLALLAGIYLQAGLVFFAASYGISQLLGGVLSSILVRRHCSLQGRSYRSLLSEQAYFAAAGITVIALPQLGPLVLEKVTSFKEVGYFAAAYRIPALLYLIPGTVAGAFYPALFRNAYRDRENHRALTGIQLKLMSVLGAALALPLVLYPETVLGLIFGPEWQSGTPVIVLQILSGLVVLQSLNYPLADALSSLGFQKRRALSQGGAMALALVLFIVLGLNFGAAGGAVTLICAELCLLLSFSISLPGGRQIIIKNLDEIVVAILVGFLAYWGRLSGLSPVLGLWLPSLLFIVISLIMNKNRIVFRTKE